MNTSRPEGAELPLRAQGVRDDGAGVVQQFPPHKLVGSGRRSECP